MKLVKQDCMLNVDNKTIEILGKTVPLVQFFKDPDYSLDFKMWVVKEITFELRVRGFNGYDIFSYVSSLWPEYEKLKK